MPNTYSQHTEDTDRLLHTLQSKLTLGLSPAAISLAYVDWLVHLSHSWGKLSELQKNAVFKSQDFMLYFINELSGAKNSEPFIRPLPHDKRFEGEGWGKWPFNVIHQSFLLTEQWWHYATQGVRGLAPNHAAMVDFGARQILDMLSPANFPLTNPEVLKTSMKEGGANLWKGFLNFIEEAQRANQGLPPAQAGHFKVGENLALTPGKVVMRNHLVELIQYEPTKPKVHAEPILIIPAWIMKYYILDLSPQNSLVKYLLDQGHQVFMISWRNPTPEDRDLGMDDYLKQGPLAALAAIQAIIPGRKIHAAGYCLGGTLLAIAAAYLARENKDILASATFFAAQTDFTEAGEIMLFIDESQVTFLEDMMWDQGMLDTKQMAGAFQLLRSNDLIWSKVIRQYMLGEDESLNDLMAWNADATRMPYKMHSEYLRKLFLGNDLAYGRFLVDERPIALTDIRVPLFAVGTTKDHVAPWKSVYKLNLLADTEVTFLLASGGHNAGIVSEPGRPRRSYQVALRTEADKFVDPDSWAKNTPVKEGSWWPEWQAWLAQHSGGEMVKPGKIGNKEYPALIAAPGEYVLMR